jgi:ribulose-phosphate 3-epimerase
MARRRTLVSTSILDCDLSDLARESLRAFRAGSDRLHLDVMDGHFVPNISFGPTVIKRLRRIGRQPFDAHLMISEPGRYMDQFIDAGCDSITFHVEVEEPIEPTLLKIRKAGRQAGLALRPATPLAALEPYRELLDIVMVMTVEPGFGGQSFMKDAAAKILPAHELFRDRAPELSAGQVHVDGGVSRQSAEMCGGLGAEVLVVGSTLWKEGVDIAREMRLIKALADEGYENGPARGRAAVPHSEWVTFATLPRSIGKCLLDAMEAGGIPMIQLRADRAAGSAGPREYELLIPASWEVAAIERFGRAREQALAAAEAGRGAVAGARTERGETA